MSSNRLVLAWTTSSARQQELATLLDGNLFIVHPSIRWTILRYVVSAWRTWRRVRCLHRGDVCIVTAPPVFAPVIATVAARRGVAIVMDSHPGAFGLMGDRLSMALQPLHKWSLRRAKLVLVTTASLAQIVRASGGRALVFHEVDVRTTTQIRTPRPGSGVLFPGTFARDEPMSVVLEAAACLPDVPFRLTGDPTRAPQIEISRNVQLTGWLSPAEFGQEMHDAAVVLVLSTDKESVMRTAYEATRAQRPLVVTRTHATETYFPHAWHVDNDPPQIANVLRDVLSAPSELVTNRTKLALEYASQITASQATALIDTLDDRGA